MLSDPTPDAVFLPESMKRGETSVERLRSVLLPAEAWLGVDRSRGERAWLRQQPGGRLFITRSTEDTIYFPNDSPFRGRPRYRWVARPGGIEFGYLVDAARDNPIETNTR